MNKITPEQIDALLPQTQCGLCGYGGCMPYAEAMVYENAPIHLCPPGGVQTLQQLGHLIGIDPTPYQIEMQEKAKPQHVALIREAECIGCTKCIQVCPVDAILGSAKQMHTVITNECTGCELCVPACPVDCIDMLLQPENPSEITAQKKELFRSRFNARNKRLAEENTPKKSLQENISLAKKKNYIQEAIARAKAKKLK